MPTEEENVQYLYLILTHGGAPTINWDAVGEALDLKKGAVSKRWSRLKKAVAEGEVPGPSVYKFLWLCVKHSSRDKVMNWNEIAEQCGTTAGAASKRYSRMKQALEAGDAPPGRNLASPAPKTPSKATPKKGKVTTPASEATPTPKRKRASPKKKMVKEEEEEVDVKPELDEDEDENMQTPKKAKVEKSKATPKSKIASKKEVNMSVPTSEATTFIKAESEDNIEDSIEAGEDWVDAKEWVNELVGGSTIADDEDQAGRELSPRFV